MPFQFINLRIRFWTKMFNVLAEMLNDKNIFMNIGYAGLPPDVDEQPPSDISQFDRFSKQLYRHVIGDITLQGKDVLEVGCGRGGGSLYLMRNWHPKSLTAVDIAQQLINRCKVIHAESGIHFCQANAMALPFLAGQFDVVINIESSHCYPSRQNFYTEVFRVLRPGGFFLYTDLFSVQQDSETEESIHRLLRSIGFLTIREQNITKNVVKSRDLMAQSGLFEEAMESWLCDEIKPYRAAILPFMKNALYHTGTVPYECLKSEIIEYWCWIFQKPVIPTETKINHINN